MFLYILTHGHSFLHKAPRALALAAVIAVGFSGPLLATGHPEGPTLTREELLKAALAGDPSARSALRLLFSGASGDGEAIAALAVDLIGSLEGDPVAITDAASLIADVASEILTTQPIVRVSVDGGFILPPGALGWDLGSPDSPAFKGFTKLTQFDKNIISGSTGGIQRPGGDGLLSDGLINVKTVFLNVDVPDGLYRLILLTDDQGNQTFVNPLGQAITVNGVRTPMPRTSPNSWTGNGLLGGVGGAFGAGTGTGGATVIFVEVINGRLVIEFDAAVNSDLLLTGLILEPIDEPSVLSTPEEIFNDDEEVLFAEAVIADAIGEALETIASAAGDEGQREDILALNEPEAEVIETVSPN